MKVLPGRGHQLLLATILVFYACGQVLQVVFGPVPTTPLAALEVLSAAAFALVLYALCAAGHRLQIFIRRTANSVQDGSGRFWSVTGILTASALVSLLVMGGLAATGATRMKRVRESTN